MRTRLIFNPTSNHGKASSYLPAFRSKVESLSEVELAITQSHGHAVELAATAAEQGFGRVIALGGDGTTHEAANGLMRIPAASRPELGIVPLGSGNDFSFASGLRGDIKQLFNLALHGKSRSVDIGLVQDNLGRSEYWVNSLGIGLDALINVYSRSIRGFKGFWIYLLAALRAILFNYTPFQFEAKIDQVPWHESLLMLVAVNGIREGGVFLIAPDGKLDDNRLDFSSVGLISRPQMLKALTAYMKGTQGQVRGVNSGSFHTLELNSDRPLILHTDGEIFAGLNSKVTHLLIQSIPAAIRLVCSL